MSLNIIIRGGSTKTRPSDRVETVSPFDSKDSVLSQMVHDRTMFNMIKNGRGSDRGLLKEVETMERSRAKDMKDKWLSEKKARLVQKKIKYGIR